MKTDVDYDLQPERTEPRFRRWCRECLSLLWVEFCWKDYEGCSRFAATFHLEAQASLALDECPACGAALRDGSRLTVWPLSELELVKRLDEIRAAQLAKGELDEAAVNAMSAELDLGNDFGDVAVLYGRNPADLRAELESWLGSQPEANT